ncbi:MAG: hypothetical protein JNK32_04925 [Anaerolineales bacterium]|nr:hypothetical protein [Anaerolineales bacterium]
MKTMQDFYAQMTSPSEDVPTVDRRLSALAGFSKTRIAAAASEDPWFWWEAEQPAVAA